MDTLRFISQVSYLYNTMRPDFAHKLFEDQRADFSLLMETLAMGG